jgi:cell division protein FtsB
MKLLSEILHEDNNSGDFGRALEGYPELAAALEKENAELKAQLDSSEYRVTQLLTENEELYKPHEELRAEVARLKAQLTAAHTDAETVWNMAVNETCFRFLDPTAKPDDEASCPPNLLLKLAQDKLMVLLPEESSFSQLDDHYTRLVLEECRKAIESSAFVDGVVCESEPVGIASVYTTVAYPDDEKRYNFSWLSNSELPNGIHKLYRAKADK